jgi:hypothetical protein
VADPDDSPKCQRPVAERRQSGPATRGNRLRPATFPALPAPAPRSGERTVFFRQSASASATWLCRRTTAATRGRTAARANDAGRIREHPAARKPDRKRVCPFRPRRATPCRCSTYVRTKRVSRSVSQGLTAPPFNSLILNIYSKHSTCPDRALPQRYCRLRGTTAGEHLMPDWSAVRIVLNIGYVRSV